MAEKLLSPERAAQMLDVNPETVRNWLREGKLQGVKVGRLWRVREEDLQTFLRGNRADNE